MLIRSRKLAVVALVAVLMAGCGGSDAGSSTDDSADDGPTVITLDVVDGALVGGVRTESTKLGQPVTIELSGNTADDSVHVHGYDLYIEPVDGAGSLTFDAVIPGIFELELEEAGTLLIRLKVS